MKIADLGMGKATAPGVLRVYVSAVSQATSLRKIEIVKAWGQILRGRRPSLSIEITRECPLRCPGCYAYDDAHLTNGVTLRQLADHKGDELVARVLKVVEEYQPLHLSIVGGDPLVRYRELEILLPELDRRNIHVQVVTSAFRKLPESWNRLSRLNPVVSIDGLPPEHDARRKPATYERILKNISGSRITVHCTVTGQMMKRAGYLQEFLQFWTPRPETKRVWISFFTPQRGAGGEEILTPAERTSAIEELLRLRKIFSKLDMPEQTLREFYKPPSSPQECIFAQTTHNLSADLTTKITPCQFGGDPDCSQCGCVASMGLAAVGHYPVVPGLTAGKLFHISRGIGRAAREFRRPGPSSQFANGKNQIQS